MNSRTDLDKVTSTSSTEIHILTPRRISKTTKSTAYMYHHLRGDGVFANPSNLQEELCATTAKRARLIEPESDLLLQFPAAAASNDIQLLNITPAITECVFSLLTFAETLCVQVVSQRLRGILLSMRGFRFDTPPIRWIGSVYTTHMVQFIASNIIQRRDGLEFFTCTSLLPKPSFREGVCIAIGVSDNVALLKYIVETVENSPDTSKYPPLHHLYESVMDSAVRCFGCDVVDYIINVLEFLPSRNTYFLLFTFEIPCALFIECS